MNCAAVETRQNVRPTRIFTLLALCCAIVLMSADVVHAATASPLTIEMQQLERRMNQFIADWHQGDTSALRHYLKKKWCSESPAKVARDLAREPLDQSQCTILKIRIEGELGYVEIACKKEAEPSTSAEAFGTRYLWRRSGTEWYLVPPWDEHRNPVLREQVAFDEFVVAARSSVCSREFEKEAARRTEEWIKWMINKEEDRALLTLSSNRYMVGVLDSWDGGKYNRSIIRSAREYTLNSVSDLLSVESAQCYRELVQVPKLSPTDDRLGLAREIPSVALPGARVVVVLGIQGGGTRRVVLEWIFEGGELKLWNIS